MKIQSRKVSTTCQLTVCTIYMQKKKSPHNFAQSFFLRKEKNKLWHNQIENKISTCLNHKHPQSFDMNNENRKKFYEESFQVENIQPTCVPAYLCDHLLITLNWQI